MIGSMKEITGNSRGRALGDGDDLWDVKSKRGETWNTPGRAVIGGRA